MTSTSSKQTVQAVVDFIKAAGLQPGSKPGFAHALQLSYNTIRRNELHWDADQSSLVYRYNFAPLVSPSDQSGITLPKLTLATLTAIMDELSTDACFAVGNPSPPGVSLHMNTEWLVDNPADALLCQQPPNQATVDETINQTTNKDKVQLDVVNTVSKLGRTVSFTRTEFVHPITKQVLALGSHVKYMPTGNFFLDIAFNKPWAYELFKKFTKFDTTVPPLYDDKILEEDVIGTHLEMTGLGHARFNITREHTNPFGGLHGGCHAILMEIVALPLAKAVLEKRKAGNNVPVASSTTTFLQSQKIDYLSAGKVGQTILIQADVINDDDVSSTNDTIASIRVKLCRSDGRVLSDGILRFSSNSAVVSKL